MTKKNVLSFLLSNQFTVLAALVAVVASLPSNLYHAPPTYKEVSSYIKLVTLMVTKNCIV